MYVEHVGLLISIQMIRPYHLTCPCIVAYSADCVIGEWQIKGHAPVYLYCDKYCVTCKEVQIRTTASCPLRMWQPEYSLSPKIPSLLSISADE